MLSERLTEVLRNFFLTKQETDAFSELLTITGISQKLTENPESYSHALDDLMGVIQANWKRRDGSERWDLKDSAGIEREHCLKLLESLGFISEKNPELRNYDYVLLLGATQECVKNRLNYLANLWAQEIRFDRIVLLGGDRLLSEERDPVSINLELGATEADMMETVFCEHHAAWLGALLGLAEMPHDLVRAQAGLGRLRANTEDTVKSWIETNPKPGRVLAISNQPYVLRQNLTIRNCLSDGFELHTAGFAASRSVKIAVVLDELYGFVDMDARRVRALLTESDPLREADPQACARMRP